MHTLGRLLLLIVTVMTLAASGCKATVENQTAAWAANVKTVAGLQSTYAGFKPALEARMKSAEEAKAKADGLEGEAAAKALQTANRTLMSGFVGKLKGIDDKLQTLRKKSVEAAAKAGDKSSQQAAKIAADDAKATVERVRATLKKGASNEAGADAVLEKVEKDIRAATKAVDAVLEADRDKRDAKASDNKAAEDKAANDKAAADAKVADWKCEYCDAMNKHDHAKCGGCGAPRKQ